MVGNASIRHEVIMAGLGGGGVLTAGRLLGTAATIEYPNALWYPSYAGASRGGPCECSVIFSTDDIYSQLLDLTQVVIALHPTQVKPFERRLRPNGLMIAERLGLQDRPTRTDVRFVEVPAVETALKMLGGIQGANLILLGAYVGIVKSIRPELVEQVIETRFKGRQAALDSNMSSFRTGLRLVEDLALVAAV